MLNNEQRIEFSNSITNNNLIQIDALLGNLNPDDIEDMKSVYISTADQDSLIEMAQKANAPQLLSIFIAANNRYIHHPTVKQLILENDEVLNCLFNIIPKNIASILIRDINNLTQESLNLMIEYDMLSALDNYWNNWNFFDSSNILNISQECLETLISRIPNLNNIAVIEYAFHVDLKSKISGEPSNAMNIVMNHYIKQELNPDLDLSTVIEKLYKKYLNQPDSQSFTSSS